MIKNIIILVMFLLVIVLGYITYMLCYSDNYTPKTLDFHIYKDGLIMLNGEEFSIKNTEDIWENTCTNKLVNYLNDRHKKYGTENVVIGCEPDISLTNLYNCIKFAKLTRLFFLGIQTDANLLDFTFDHGSGAMSDTIMEQYEPYERKIIFVSKERYVLYDEIFGYEELCYVLEGLGDIFESYKPVEKIYTRDNIRRGLNSDDPFSLQIVCVQSICFADLSYLLDICAENQNIDQLFILFM